MKQLNCEYVRDVYPDVLNGAADAATAAAVRAHIADCTDCRAEAELIDALHATRVVLPIGLQDRVVAGVISAPQARRSGGRQWAIAATVAATLIGGAVMWNVVRRPEAQPTVAVRNHENGLGVVSVEAAMVSGTGSLQDLTVEELEQLLGEIES